MSSGSSVFSIMPPKRARMERFILVQSPISAHPPANFGPTPQPLLMYDIYVQAVSTPVENCLEYNSTVKSLPESLSGRRPPANIAPELHARPMNFCQRLITNVQRRGKVFGGCRNSQNPAAGRDKTAVCVF